MSAVSQRPPWPAIGLLSAGALAYEVLLLRLFAQVHWHHLIGLVISLALLGYGASGTFLSLVRERVLAHYRGFFLANAVLFGLGGPVCFVLAANLPLNPLLVGWEARQLVYLALVYLLLAIPFFAVANAIGLSLARFPDLIGRVYAVDLLGAGLGAGGVVGLLFLLSPAESLRVTGLMGLAAALWVLRGGRGRHARLLAGSVLMLAVLALLIPASWLAGEARDYKPLHQALAAKGARITRQAGNPLGTVTVVENDLAPTRYAPGLSLLATALPPRQAAVFMDGERSGALPLGPERGFLDFLPSALPYHLLNAPSVLVNGAADVTATHQALALGAGRVAVVEANPLFRDLLLGSLQVGEDEPVSLIDRGWRRQLLRPGQAHDLVQLAVADELGVVAGLRAQREDYRFTVEGLGAALAVLSPGGILSVTRGLQLPPRGSLRLVTTAIDALRRFGVAEPARHLVMLRSWNTVTLLVSLRPFSVEQRASVRAFCRLRLFDLVHLSDMRADEANRFNQLAAPMFHDAVKALLSPARERAVADYAFRIEATRDDRPYFHRYTRPGQWPELLAQPAGAGRAQLDWGYVMLLIALSLALVSSALFILLPLAWLRTADHSGRPGWRVPLYFGAIGLAFLFIEIAFIQRLQLFLGAPVYAVAVVLGGFLVFAGLGSHLSGRLVDARGRSRAVLLLSLSIGIVALAYLYLLPWMSAWPVAMGLPLRVLLCLLLIAPLATLMGMPFPIGLASLATGRPAWLPWAWAVNGCASVVAALLAPLLAMEVGFSGLILLAVMLYLLAWLVFSSGQAWNHIDSHRLRHGS